MVGPCNFVDVEVVCLIRFYSVGAYSFVSQGQ